eukprot:13170691-Alexandrium_andersonii.AAC.1
MGVAVAPPPSESPSPTSVSSWKRAWTSGAGCAGPCAGNCSIEPSVWVTPSEKSQGAPTMPFTMPAFTRVPDGKR